MKRDRPLASISSRYEVLALLGEGGMGRVYKAKDKTLNRIVAIKVLVGECAALMVPRFQREAQTMSSLKHSNLVEIFDFGITDNGFAYLVMEYLTGEELAEILKREGHLSQEAVVTIALAVAKGMGHAHQKGVIHRDLKPANIFVGANANFNSIKVFDFGISKALDKADEGALTMTGFMIGTPLYMSPEQADGVNVDERSDLYSLGCIMYECLSGAPPFSGGTALDTVDLHKYEPPRPLREGYPELSISRDLDNLVLKLLEKSPDARYASMSEVIEALTAVEDDRRVTTDAHEATVEPPLKKRALMLPVITAASIVSAVGIYSLFHWFAPPEEKKPQPPKPDKYEWRRYFKESKTWPGLFHDLPIATDHVAAYDEYINPKVFALLPKHCCRLELEKCSVNGEGLDEIANLRLEFFKLHNGVRKGSMSHFNKMKTLKELCLRIPPVTTEYIKDVSLPNLTSLDLDTAGITDDAIPVIANNFPNLEKLNLSSTMLRGNFGKLSSMKRLKEFRMNVVAVPDKGLESMKGLALQNLEMDRNSYLTPKGLRTVLTQNPDIVRLSILDCPNVSAAVANKIKNEVGSKTEIIASEKPRDLNSPVTRYQNDPRIEQAKDWIDLIDKQ